MMKNEYNLIRTDEFLPIIEAQRNEFFNSLGTKIQNGIVRLPYHDKTTVGSLI